MKQYIEMEKFKMPGLIEIMTLGILEFLLLIPIANLFILNYFGDGIVKELFYEKIEIEIKWKR